jgi:hypothetical protein
MGDRFEQLADEFEARIRAAGADGSEDITLVFHWVDEGGNAVSTSRESIGTLVKVSGGTAASNQAFAASMYLGTLIDNMRRRVLDAPKTPTMMKGWPVPVFVREIEMEMKGSD